MQENIPDPSVRRLSAYLRQLELLSARGVEHVSSRQLAEYIKAGDAQVRRDLALFGQFGRRGVGYDVTDLISIIRIILGTNRRWNVIVVGAGQLCGALLRYPGFEERGFCLVAAFDTDPHKIGTYMGDVKIRHVNELESVIEREDVHLAMLTVPPDVAQPVAERLSQAGIQGIINFSSGDLTVPEDVHVNQVDITSHLEQLSFLVSRDRSEPQAGEGS